MQLFIILFLHQTTTLLKSFILLNKLFIILFLHQTTTEQCVCPLGDQLFIILFLHQTTTKPEDFHDRTKLFIILFLHQTTTCIVGRYCPIGCLSSCSYIKPQLTLRKHGISTSCLSSCSYIKPQLCKPDELRAIVVYHLVPTSNHNHCTTQLHTAIVVYHLVPTSNHNFPAATNFMDELFIILFLHQTTTRLSE